MTAWLYWSHVLGVAGAAAIAFGLTYWIRNQYDRPAATWMARLLAVLGLWAIITTLQLLVQPKGVKIALFLLGKPLGKSAFFLWFVFTLVFTNREYWLTRPVKAALAGGFGLITVLTLTNPGHGLLWSDFRIIDEGFPHLLPEPTALETTIFSALGLLGAVGFGLLLVSLLTSRQTSKGQLLTVVAGFLVAIPAAVLQDTDLLPVSGFEYGQINSILFFVAIAAAISRYNLFVVETFARDAVFDAVEEGIVVLDDHGHIVDYNPPAVDIFPGLEGSIGDTCTSVFPETVFDNGTPEGDDGGFSPALVDTVRGATDGNQRRFSVDVSPLSIRGVTKGYGIILRDQTEIEHYVHELEQQSKRLDDFASTVSHDLRSPLTVASGQLELARETGDLEALEQVDEALDRIDEIIDDALTLARSGQFDVDREMVSLHDVITASWEQTKTESATLETAGIASGSLVYADANRLKTVFENLFRNAIDHGPSDVTLTVETTEEGFAVADTGPGIPEEHRENVFERGFTTGEETTGLGLSIVEQIVTGHNWRIDVTESATGGARFEIST